MVLYLDEAPCLSKDSCCRERPHRVNGARWQKNEALLKEIPGY
jgi:hypothetical protein